MFTDSTSRIHLGQKILTSNKKHREDLGKIGTDIIPLKGRINIVLLIFTMLNNEE